MNRLKNILLCSIFLFVSCKAFAEDYSHYFSTVRAANGNAVAQATITVYLANTTTLAVLANDGNGASRANPFLTDGLGNYDFWVAPGSYKIVTTKIGIGTNTINNVFIGTQNHGNRHSSNEDPIILTNIHGVLPDAQKITLERNSVISGTATILNFQPNQSISPLIEINGNTADLTFDLINSSVTTSALAPNSVISSKILDGTILNADISPSAGISETKLLLNYPTHSNLNDPTAGQKAALAGSYGTPSGTNTYVNNSDPRLSDPRTPIAHGSTHSASGSDPVTINVSQLAGLNAGTNLTQDLEEENHHIEHEDGGNDEISVTGLSGILNDPQKIVLQKNGSAVGIQSKINFIEGGNTTLTLTNDPSNGRVNVQIDANYSESGSPNTLTSSHIFVGNSSNIATDVSMSGDITITNTGVTSIGAGKVTSTMLESSYSGIGSCSSGFWISGLNANGSPTCTQLNFSNLLGSITDSQVPDNITVLLASEATSLSANGTNCASGEGASGVDESGNAEGCTTYAQLVDGLLSPSVLGTGTPDETTFLNGNNEWVTISGGGGSIDGSTGSSDNRLLRSDGTGGATIQSSEVTVDDSGNVTLGVSASGTLNSRRKWLLPGEDFDISEAQSGSGISNYGAGVTVSLNLPNCSQGLEYMITIDEAHTVYISAQSGQLIYLGNSLTDTIGSSSTGSTLIITCSRNSGVWHTIYSGSWTSF